jgi:cell division initiation protein
MRITPLDIRKQEFRKTMRGLDSDEVYAFLTTVAEEYEAVLSDNKQLRERIVEIEERLKEYKTIETNLRNTLITAERVTNEAKENARREASLIVRESEVEAEKAAEAIRAHTQQLRREVLELKRQKDNYLTRFRTLLESHHNVLDGFQEDFASADKDIKEIGQKVEEDLNKSVPAPRMSREKITEEFAHGPKGKATWSDEQRREDAPRPSMPEPGQSVTSQPDVSPFDPEDRTQGEPPVNEGQTSLLPDDEKYNTNHIDVDPVGAMGAPTDEASNTPAGDTPVDTGDSQNQAWSGDEVRRNVAKSIEEQLYPEAAAGADQAPPASAPDQWKQYDVRAQKQDWKDYEINESAKPEKPAAKLAVKDSEVEKALSGLTEVTEQASDQKTNENGEQDIVTLRDEVPKDGGQKVPALKPEAAVPEKAQKPVGGPPKKDKTEWSMEDLRKNLSNLTKDD